MQKHMMDTNLCKRTYICRCSEKQCSCEEKHECLSPYITKAQYSAHRALWFFMKQRPCLRNSEVSPMTGHPIVPGGRPFFRCLTSFHLRQPMQSIKRQRTMPRSTIVSHTHARNPLSLSFPLSRVACVGIYRDPSQTTTTKKKARITGKKNRQFLILTNCILHSINIIYRQKQ